MFTRRSLAGAVATAGLLAATPRGFSSANFGPVDTVILGGTFHTIDSRVPAVQGLAIAGDRILAVGSVEEIRTLATRSTRVIDGRGLTITPGFIDSHSHPLMTNSATRVFVGLSSIARVQDALRQRAAGTPPGHWVVGSMYDDTKFEEGRPVERADLDAVSTAHPVIVQHRGGHTAVVNSKAFELAGITPETPNSPGGEFYRRGDEFTGRVAETAMHLFHEHGVWPQATREANRENVRLVTGRMAAAGLTSTTDARQQITPISTRQGAGYKRAGGTGAVDQQTRGALSGTTRLTGTGR